VWLVLGMALFKDRSITDVVNKLDLALPGSSHVTVAPSAISQARARLGQEPVRWLFERCANKWAHQSADGASFCIKVAPIAIFWFVHARTPLAKWSREPPPPMSS